MSARILIVDDEEDLRYAMAVRLKAEGFVCDTAQDGMDGLMKALQQPPDLVIADLLMPKMNGYDMLKRLREDPRTAAVPVMILTALPERARERQLIKMESITVMQKPFDTAQLITAVRTLLSGGASHGDREESPHR